MSEPIVIAPCADGHHSSIVHLSFVRSFTDKDHALSLNNNNGSNNNSSSVSKFT